MRDLFIFGLIAVCLLLALRKPQCGILVWVWVSVMNPHRLAYGWLSSFPILDVVAAVTIFSVIINAKKESARVTWQPVLTWLLIFYVWCCLTTVFSVSFERAYEPWLKFTKSLLPAIFLMLYMNKRHWIVASIAVFVLSISFFGIKGGLFTLLTGGGNRVYGPPNSSWGDNTSVSIAMLIVIPIMLAGRHLFTGKGYRYGVIASVIISFMALLGTQSRGGFVGLAGQVIYVLYRSNKKILVSLILLIILAIGMIYMPDNWTDRMSTISTDTSELDESASNRIIQWGYAIDIANERPLFGNGFNAFYYQPYYLEFVAHLDRNRAVHSNYFQVLGEQGYIGLVLYLAMWLTFLISSEKYARKALQHDDLKWAGHMLQAMQFGFVGYAFNGLTVNLAYLDLAYFLMAFSVLLVSHIQTAISDRGGENLPLTPVRGRRSRSMGRA